MDDETLFGILGVIMIYVWIHFIVIQFLRSWKERTGYEKFLTIASIVLFVLFFLGAAGA